MMTTHTRSLIANLNAVEDRKARERRKAQQERDNARQAPLIAQLIITEVEAGRWGVVTPWQSRHRLGQIVIRGNDYWSEPSNGRAFPHKDRAAALRALYRAYEWAIDHGQLKGYQI